MRIEFPVKHQSFGPGASAELSLREVVERIGQESKGGDRIEVRFSMNRVIPLDLRPDARMGLTRIRFKTWALTMPKDMPLSADNGGLRWIHPAEPVWIAKAEFVRDEPLPPPFAIFEEYCKAKEAIKVKISQKPPPEEAQRLRACLFWLGLDLGTSFDQIDVGQVSGELGISKDLYSLVQSTKVEWLRAYLETRWRARAALHAAGQPTGPDPRPLLPSCAAHRHEATLVIKLLLAWINLVCPDPDLLWWSVLLWASGRLGPGKGLPKLNMEPNSAAIASLPELFDLAEEDLPDLIAMERKQCRQLRVMFVSALEPYFEVYRSGKDRPPRKAQYYRRENLDPRVRDPRWENDRIKNHISIHRPALKYLDENVPWVMHRWGATLAEGLRDERHVKAAAHEPVLKVM